MTMMMSGENIGFCCRECFLAIWGARDPICLRNWSLSWTYGYYYTLHCYNARHEVAATNGNRFSFP